MSSEPDALRLADQIAEWQRKRGVVGAMEHDVLLARAKVELLRLHAEIEDCRAVMREALEALDLGHEAAQDIAHDMRLKYEGYMNRQQKAADNDVAKIAAAIEKLKARAV